MRPNAFSYTASESYNRERSEQQEIACQYQRVLGVKGTPVNDEERPAHDAGLASARPSLRPAKKAEDRAAALPHGTLSMTQSLEHRSKGVGMHPETQSLAPKGGC